MYFLTKKSILSYIQYGILVLGPFNNYESTECEDAVTYGYVKLMFYKAFVWASQLFSKDCKEHQKYSQCMITSQGPWKV